MGSQVWSSKAGRASSIMLNRYASSLKVRVMVWVSLFVLAAIWGLAIHVTSVLRADLKQAVGDQLSATLNYIVNDIDTKIQMRVDVLQEIATSITPEILADPAKVNRLLRQQNVSLQFFPIGIFVADRQGVSIAEHPTVKGRLGGSVADRDYFRAVMAGSGLTIGKPLQGRFWKQAIAAIALPLRDASGAASGVLIGAMILSGPELFGLLEKTRLGQTGGFLVISPKDRIFVSATDKSRILKPIPAPGINSVLDQRIETGVENIAIGVNSLGVETLSVSRNLRTTGWVAIVDIATDEAFAPIEKLKQRIYIASFVLSFALILVMRFVLGRLLAPLAEASEAMRSMTQDGNQFAALPVRRDDEIGQMVENFNNLVVQRKRMESVSERERLRLQTILRTASDGIHILDGDGVLVEANQAFLDMLGYDDAAIGVLRVADWDAQDTWEIIRARNNDLIAHHGHAVFETRHRRHDGAILDVEINASGIEIEGKGYLYAASRDITLRKQVEQQLRIAATVFEAQEGMFVTDANNLILRVNRAFTEITGYTAEEAVGQTPGLLNSGRHDKAFYTQMWLALERLGAWQGEIWNRRKSGEVYPEWLNITAVKSSAGEVTHYVATLTDITKRKQAEDEIKHLAFYDALTQLPNRRLLFDRLHQALTSSARHKRNGAVMLLDLDNFKTLNDTFGHETGDQFLVEVSARLEASVREGDTVARQGGDEFVVILEDLSEDALAAMQAEIVAVKILEAILQPYHIKANAEDSLAGRSYQTSVSIGITLFRGNSVSVDELMKRADTAMYQAKAAGRNTLRFFDPEMQSAVMARATLESDLREGIRNKQFLLYYQAQVDAVGKLTGAEALLRWEHPERGLVLPGHFISIAEETGLILPLGHWVLETACAQLASWAALPGAAHLTVAVNVSTRQFRDTGFVDQVMGILAKTGANPTKLKLEITESLLLEDVDAGIGKMMALKAKGVGFSLDDFGTGYSSLSYLKQLPLDQLKIDQSFVRNLPADSNERAIAIMIIALAKSMGLGVIAEGVETEDQLVYLAQNGCNAFQGYLFGRPVSVEKFGGMVASLSVRPQ